MINERDPRRRLLGLLNLLCFALIAVIGSTAPIGRVYASSPRGAAPRLALVIGNSAYESAPRLPNAGNDGRDMCAAVKALGYAAYCFTDVKTRIELRAIIQDFEEKLSPESVAIVYYAGHAAQVAGENYFLPVTASVTSRAALQQQTVDISYLMRHLQQAKGALKIIIVDACRDNPLSNLDATDNVSRINITTFPANTFVLYGTASQQTAADGSERNGLLTKNLLAHLDEPGDLNDLFNRVSDGMQDESKALGHPQTPEIRRSSTAVYCLVRCSETEELKKQIEELRGRVAAGDQKAQVHLANVIAQLKAQQTTAAAAAQRASSVPPAY